jgi:hypothetical protein
LEDIVLVCWWPLICQLSNYNTSKTNHWFEKDLATYYQAKAHQVMKIMAPYTCLVKASRWCSLLLGLKTLIVA